MDRLKNRIPGLNYWLDITGVESADEFDDKIVSAIDNSAYVIFFLSENSIASPYTKDEVTYAKNTDKKVLPVLLPGAKLKGWFLFKFGRVDYIECDNAIHFDKLVKNLATWTGKKEQPVQPKPEPKKVQEKRKLPIKPVEVHSEQEKKQKGPKINTKGIFKVAGLLIALYAVAYFAFGIILFTVKSCENREEKNNAEEELWVEEEIKTTGEAIDLGLSVKWASYNVGATAPEEYGGYYAWGETEEKSDCSWDTYKYCNGTSTSMTKYCTDNSYGTVDNKNILEPSDDVAHVNWGGEWRMPRLIEIEELLNNCTWTWTTLNGVKGYRVTGPNGNSIFLPAAGHRDGTEVYSRGSNGYYWSSSLGSSYSDYAYYLSFNGGYYFLNYRGRYYGRTVRPVCP